MCGIFGYCSYLQEKVRCSFIISSQTAQWDAWGRWLGRASYPRTRRPRVRHGHRRGQIEGDGNNQARLLVPLSERTCFGCRMMTSYLELAARCAVAVMHRAANAFGAMRVNETVCFTNAVFETR